MGAKNVENSLRNKQDVVIVGGVGHVGLPLGLALADRGLNVILYDTNSSLFSSIEQGKMPFLEQGAQSILKRVIHKRLWLSSDVTDVSKAKFVVVAVGTPVDDHLNPKLKVLFELFTTLKPYLNPNQIIIIRSTVYPRTCTQLSKFLDRESQKWHIAYCPERIAEGQAIKELKLLPQLVAGLTERATAEAKSLFVSISPEVVTVTVEEAELAKLFSNAWRYIQFAVANQFYMIANNFNVDFDNVRAAMVKGYGRAASLPTAGFAAGPCLLKDTLQLAAFNNNNFLLGHAAMMINEGLPDFIVEKLRQKYNLSKTKVGILGMTFKADVDDTRDSLSYKLGKILCFYGAKVSYTDEYAKDPTFISKEKLVKSSDVVIIGVPHGPYKGLRIPKNVEVINPWGLSFKQ